MTVRWTVRTRSDRARRRESSPLARTTESLENIEFLRLFSFSFSWQTHHLPPIFDIDKVSRLPIFDDIFCCT